ncbi:cytochrome c oxidase assembly protein [Salibacterium aidingense]|uniref:cytochrome c oxidase assembly protein n=1 Tax=Salibacterium aidingense TaxID=384933 RepID=UPI000415823F|nr:cytochrome c oxidase assembly protein [Salibacterium aidingense]
MTHDHLELLPQVLLGLPFLTAAFMYITAVVSNRSSLRWPFHRTVLWLTGCILAFVSTAGPLAQQAHSNFIFHMTGHLLLGMLAPLLMVLAAPMTLIFRTLPVPWAKRLTRLLRSRAAGMLTDPAAATFLNIGGLWVLYTTALYGAMHENVFLHLMVHFHVYLAGFLFTASMIYIDPIPHRRPFLYRSVVLVLALAGHGILSKHLFANPPAEVTAAQAKAGSMLMYYGGDVIDLIIIFLLCLHWYKNTRPKPMQKKQTRFKPMHAGNTPR